MRRGIVLGLTLVLAVWASPARAGLAIAVGSASIAQGSTGTVDVLISSNNNDSLNNFGFEFQISGPHDLQFVQPSTDTWVTSTNPPYVLQNATLAFDATSPTGDFVTTINSQNDTYYGGNGTTATDASGNTTPGPSVTLTSGTNYLLVALTLDTTGTNVGDVYTIGLVPSSGNGSNDPSIGGNANTFFDTLDSNSNEKAHVGFTSTSGTITITPASVPEPGSLVLGLGAMAVLAGVGAVRRRRGRKGPVR